MAAKRRTPADKTAILLLGLGEDIASEILKHFNPKDLNRVVAAMTTINRVEAEELNAVMDELFQLLNRASVIPTQGGSGQTRAILARAFGAHQAEQWADSLSTPTLDALESLSARDLAQILVHEHPQTMAIILAYAHPQQAGATLKYLAASLQGEIIIRIANLGPVDASIIAELNELLQSESRQRIRGRAQKRGGSTFLANVLGSVDSSFEEALLDQLDERQPQLSEEIREKLFAFDDLLRIDQAGIITLLAQTEAKSLLLAVQGVSPAVKDHILSGMSDRKRKSFGQDEQALGRVLSKDIEAARRLIIDKVQSLAAEGKITIRSKNEVYI